jgi:opacity protein-like surface antigen
MTCKRLVSVLVFVTALAGAAPALYAQTVVAGQTEAVGFVGGVSDGGGSIFGGGIQYALGPRLLFAGQFGYLTGGEDFSGFGVDFDSHAIAIDANVQYLFPMTNEKFTPYVLGGLGFVRATASASIDGFDEFDESASDSSVGLNLGGGLRWSINEKWGVRPELTFFIADGNHVRFTAGVYYRFGS